MTRLEANARISAILQLYMTAADHSAFDLLPEALTAGKLYEAYALGLIARQLVTIEGFQLTLENGNYLPLKSSPGPINRTYPHITLLRSGAPVAEMWTDIEFLSMSHFMRPSGAPQRGEYHELDIAIVDPGLTGRPRHDHIWLAAECKNTGYHKGLLKEVLGVRRELSLLSEPTQTHFDTWPAPMLACNPASCLLVYSTDPAVHEYSRPGEVFSIVFVHEELIL
jgi:hypothetical protein